MFSFIIGPYDFKICSWFPIGSQSKLYLINYRMLTVICTKDMYFLRRLLILYPSVVSVYLCNGQEMFYDCACHVHCPLF